jgi:hypothetical protein
MPGHPARVASTSHQTESEAIMTSTTTPLTAVGFIGLGDQGAPMARDRRR